MRVVVVGNEKGGSGKSTTAAHLALGLLLLGKRVATLDIDTRQQTMTRFFCNRDVYATTHGLALPLPDHRLFVPSVNDSLAIAESETERRFDEAIGDFDGTADYLVIDSPGSDNTLSRYAHSHADVLVTPVNDSFVDLDVLVDIDAETFRALRPSRYCVMVWEQKKRRAARRRRHRVDRHPQPPGASRCPQQAAGVGGAGGLGPAGGLSHRDRLQRTGDLSRTVSARTHGARRRRGGDENDDVACRCAQRGPPTPRRSPARHRGGARRHPGETHATLWN
ncbi:MAG: division plane positioning ATPase MipZ [Alphaproteobacteria bacterium]